VKISIIIPAFNEERLLGATLQHVRTATETFTRHGWTSEIIVCDNNSTDRTATIARAHGATVVFEPVNQIARARNRGAEAASGEWLIFVDADSQPGTELFSDVAEQILGGRCLAGGSTIRLAGHHPAANRVVWLWNSLSRWRRLLAGSFVFVPAAVFRSVGGFSQELFAGEELDLSERLRAYAQKDGRKVVILHRNPLLTSARKVHLYKTRDHLKFLLRAAFDRRGTLANREACYTWYDGRR
jgi:glycosyltransferase involved in cell wall biosynthesis